MNKFFATLICIFAQSASAGWISSGGESLIYTRNPWFVKNTQVVEYCIEMDESSFSITKSEVEKLIVESLTFWRDEFEKNNSGKEESGFTKIATQQFKYLAQCQNKTPLVFKLGLKTLNAQEIDHLIEPKKFIGVTVRKEYDLVNLQGSGIIYISADKGTDAYNNNGQLVSEAWKSPTLLRYVLIHELGHFFGIAHMGSGLMSEVFMTILLNKKMAPEFETTPQMSFLNPQNNFEVCKINGFFSSDFFGVNKDILCLKFEKTKNEKLEWRVFKKIDDNKKYDEIGLVQVQSIDQSPYALKPAVIVQLPEEQKVFSALETIMGPFLIGGFFSDTSYNGTFRPKGSVRAYPIQMSLSAEKISFVGTVNNNQMTVMTYTPPSIMRGIVP